MPDWVKLLLVVLSLVLLFWSMKVYYIWKSGDWIAVVGQIVNVYPKGSQKSTTVNVKYSFAGKEYTIDALDNGSLNPEKGAATGQLVNLKIDPENPTQCIVRSDPMNVFMKSAVSVATLLSKIFPVRK